MPKMKSKRGAMKRFKITGSGNVKRSRAMKQHILTSKTTKRKRNLRKGKEVVTADRVNIRRMLKG